MKRRFWTLGLLLSLLLPGVVAAKNDGDRTIVHEWGTFTTLQDEKGNELFGINIDDEPVPSFVHNLEPYILNTPVLSHDYWLSRQKGAPRSHPFVSMRLETPVIYFYPPSNARLPMNVDVEVKFRGGWLTEFYPNADIQLPDNNKQGKFDFTKLSPSTVSQLSWRNLKVGTEGTGPQTKEQVWLAPRNVAAANLTSRHSESERYLFYRGVAQLKAPLRVSTSSDGDKISIQANFHEVLASQQLAPINHLWLMEARADGTCAYRRITQTSVTSDDDQVLLVGPRRFTEAQFAKDGRVQLEQEMHEALVEEGLYADEATALLTTWQRAYFTSPGLRLFYLVPRVWTDHYLPLSVSGNNDITRVMVGRIELVSDRQRDILGKLAKVDVDHRWLDKIDWESPARKKLLEGRSNFGDLGVNIPPHFQLYLDLGRFRNALIVAEEKRLGPGKSKLTQFINDYQLHQYRVEQ